MNDIEHLRQLMSDYTHTTDTLFDMLDDYLETPKKPSKSDLSDKEENSPKK